MIPDAVVTGVGAVTPLGATAVSSWEKLLSGASAVEKTPEGFLAAHPPSIFRGECRSRKMLVSAAREALEQSRLGAESRVCFVMSQSKPGAGIVGDFFVNLSDAPGASAASEFSFAAKCVKNVVAACSGGLQSLYSGLAALENGRYDAVVVGAVEASIEPLYAAAFGNMGVLAREAVRPFDEGREGFALGEGAAAVVVEKSAAARKRGANILSEIAGISVSSSSDIVDIGKDCKAIERVILSAAGASSAEVDYINAHGTATRRNDEAEARAISGVFGNRDGGPPAVSATKAATGHMLGAGGLAEFIFCVFAASRNIVPPTLNLKKPIAPLDFVPLFARRRAIRAAMSLSYGFGGQTGAVVVRLPRDCS